MKKQSLLFISITFLMALGIMNTKAAQGAKASKKAANEDKVSQAAVKEENKEVPPAPNPALAARREAEKNAKDILASREWPIKINQVGGKKPKSDTDILTFTPEGRVSSKNYSAKGYPASNLTVTTQSGRSTIVWETMQTNPEAGVLFWRGELDNGFMSGSLTLQTQKEAIEEYSFISMPVEAKAELEVKAQPETEAATKTETAQPAVPEGKEEKSQPKASKAKAKSKKK